MDLYSGNGGGEGGCWGLIFGMLIGLHMGAYVWRTINGILGYMHNIYDLLLGCFLDWF